MPIRPASATDVAGCQDVVRSLPDHFTPDVVDKVGVELVRDRGRVWSKDDDADVVGFVILERRFPKAAEVTWAGVRPSSQRQGVGRSLVLAALDAARADGVEVVEVKTLDASANYEPYVATRAFWESIGFVQLDVIDPLPGWQPGNPSAIYASRCDDLGLMPTAAIRDLEVHYELGGAEDGSPVLFISGTGGDLRTKPNVFDGPLATSFRVLGYDQRGLGQTSKPDAPASMADYALDAAALLEHLGGAWAGGIGVVGASFGGMVAQELAIHRPDLVSRLVLCCTSSGGDGGALYPLHELVDLDPEARRRTQLGVSDTRFGADWQQAHPDEAERILGRMRTTDDAAPSDGGDAVRAGARRQLEARAGHDTWDRLEAITAPTFVAAGRYDGIAPVANSDALVSRIPKSSLQVFEGGHLFLLQDRSAWTAIVNFLER